LPFVRRDTYDAHDITYGLVDAIHEIRIDAKTFRDLYVLEVNGVKKRAKIWKNKVREKILAVDLLGK